MDDNRTMAQYHEAPYRVTPETLPDTSVKLMLFPFSLEGAAQIWLEKEPPRLILTWDDLVSKFINKFFPPSKTTNLRNEITRFQQRFDESFYEAWDRFNDLLRACPASIKCPEKCLKIIRANPKFDNSTKQTLVAKVIQALPSLANDAVMRNVQNQGQNLQAQLNNLATSNQRLESMLSNFIKMNTASTSGSGTLPGNTITNPKEDLKGITTRSGVAYQGPAIPSTSSSPPKVMNRDTEVTKDTMLPTNNGSTEDIQPPVIQVQSQNPTSEPVVDPVSAPMPNQRTSIPFPSRRNDERRREKANDQIEKFYEIFRLIFGN
ncbi:reverse transcriptase domain-containing protein [Tanacetum coccineum]